jgi:DNA-3-methyladenine glycosylase I
VTDVASVTVGADGVGRCAWAANDDLYSKYHDEEWGTPLHGDRELFEKLSLEAFQAGLSWITILRRRPAFRAAFHEFDVAAVATMDDAAAAALLDDASIIRNRAKIAATISNAQLTLSMVGDDPGALDRLMWSFAPPRRRRPRSLNDLVAVTPESTAMSLALRKLGFRFVGPTTMHALMQSTGMVDHHIEGCWRAT